MTSELIDRKPAALPGSAEEPRGMSAGSPAPAKPAFLQQRLVSLDTYRGLIMVALAFNGFGLAATALRHIEAEGKSSFWRTVHYQFEHVEWVGCGIWDLIQPSFMFMVGVAAAFSYAKRKQQGQSYGRMLGHAVWRSIVLIFLGIFLISNFDKTTNWSLMNVLTQIGLGYTFLFLLWDRPTALQAIAAAAILVGTWLLFVNYEAAGINLERAKVSLRNQVNAYSTSLFQRQPLVAAASSSYFLTVTDTVGVPPAWALDNLSDVAPAWHKNANIGHEIDLWLLNQLPRKEPYAFNKGGYQTINFLPSLATMLFGLMCGELLRSLSSAKKKLIVLTVAGAAGLLLGQILNLTGVCPLVKRIWTPSWAVFSTGWCCLILAGLYGLVDVLGFRRWTWPLVVVGVNSIAIYCMGILLKPWTMHTYQIHVGPDVFKAWGKLWEPTLTALLVGLFFWVACFWMYRQKIFVRI